MYKIYSKILFIAILTVVLSGCEKFLAEKSDKKLSTPTTIEDFQSLLNDFSYVNGNFCSLGEASSDDFYLTDADLGSLYYESDRRLYGWQPDYVSRDLASAGDEWYHCYRGIYVTNSVLHGIEENGLRGKAADEVRGQALVFRAARYLDGVLVWSPIYNRETATSDLGMVLRLDPDMNIPSVRASVQETYDLILKDLDEAVTLLPESSVSPALPAKAAAHGLLARVHLIMGDYDQALQNAEKALVSNAAIIDFNELNPNANFPIPTINQTSVEMVFLTRMFTSEIINLNVAKISQSLLALYGEGDLRKTIYFRNDADGNHFFKGTHMGNRSLVPGIMTSELLLIAAECYARMDWLAEAEEAVNRLLVKRWDPARFVPHSFMDKDNALKTIFEERRKELVFRGVRWSDIKRLNRDGADITLTRNNNGETYILPPNDPRYAIAIPETVIEIGRIEQNPR